MKAVLTANRRRIFFSVALLYALGFALTQPIFPFFARELAGPNDEQGLWYGLLSIAYPLTKAAVTPLVGAAADTKGHRTVLIGTLVLLSITLAITALQSSFTGLLTCRLLTGVAGSNGALLHAWIPRIASSDEYVILFNDLFTAWSLAYIASKYAVPLMQEDIFWCYACGAGCVATAGTLAWVAGPDSNNAESASRLKKEKEMKDQSDQPSCANNRSMFDSLATFLSDDVILSILICELLTPRLDLFLAAKDKGATASAIAAFHGNAAVATLVARLVGINSAVYTVTGGPWGCAVYGTALTALPVAAMTDANLETFGWFALTHELMRSVVMPATRTLVQSRSSKDRPSSWIGWLHSARAVTQLTSTMSSSYLATRDVRLYCMTVASMQLILALAFSRVPTPTRTRIS